MRNKVIKFFQNLPEAPHDQFNKAFELYRQSAGKSEHVERQINAQGYTPSTLENLLYDLQKLHCISDVEKLPVVVPVIKKESQEPDARIEILNSLTEFTPFTEDDAQRLLEFAISVGNDKAVGILNAVLDKFKNDTNAGVLQLDPDSEVTGTQEETVNDDLISENKYLQSENEDLLLDKEELEEKNEALENEVANLKSLPKISQKSIRVEFPFLNEKECPDELKILVADKITAWNEYLELQAEIAKSESGEIVLDEKQLKEKAERAIECFTENQKIYEELNAYHTTGKVLGKHPIFRKLQLLREVDKMTNEELVKYKGSSSKYFSDNKKQLAVAEKQKDEECILKIKSRVEERELKLGLVNKKLGIPTK